MAEERVLTMAGQRFTLDHSSFGGGINLLGIIPLRNFDLYALVGALYAMNSFDYDAFAGSFSESGGSLGLQGGIGADYLIKNRFRIGARYVYRYNNQDYPITDVNLSRHIITLHAGIDF